MVSDPAQDQRDVAIRRLRSLRDELEGHRKRHPDPGTLVFWSDAVRFNEALRDVADEIGDDGFRLLHIDEGSAIATPTGWPERDQRPPAVGRATVLLAVRDTLRRLGEDGEGGA